MLLFKHYRCRPMELISTHPYARATCRLQNILRRSLTSKPNRHSSLFKASSSASCVSTSNVVYPRSFFEAFLSFPLLVVSILTLILACIRPFSRHTHTISKSLSRLSVMYVLVSLRFSTKLITRLFSKCSVICRKLY